MKALDRALRPRVRHVRALAATIATSADPLISAISANRLSRHSGEWAGTIRRRRGTSCLTRTSVRSSSGSVAP